MIDYDFIEIGTCFMDTLIEKSTIERGLSIEPIKEYLDKLENKPNVIKIHGAVVSDEDEKGLDVFYIEESDIDKYNLGSWMKGCNSIGKPHDFHTGYFNCPWTWHNHPNRKSLPTINLIEAGIVKQKTIPCYTYKKLIDTYNIGHVNVLKIDTEGYDCKILKSVLIFYSDKLDYLPNEISFESNAHSNTEEILEIRKLLTDLNYTISVVEDGSVTKAVKKENQHEMGK